MSENNIPAEYKPISMWGYFGYEILFSIPLIGLICLIVFAFASKNKNVKNFARSYFCMLILVIVLAVICLAIISATGAVISLEDIVGSL